jgi:hypothetical protein
MTYSRRASPLSQSSFFTPRREPNGPTEKHGCIISRKKNARARNTRKSWQHFEHLRTAIARTGRYEEDALHKAGVGANRPRVQRCASS